MAYDIEKRVAMEAVVAAAELCERVQEEMPQAVQKSDASPVTVADFGAQAVICKALRDAFPDDPVVAEETADELWKPEMAEVLDTVIRHVRGLYPHSTREDVIAWIEHGRGRIGPRFWTLDPIDGTKGFLRGGQYAIALALVEDGRVRLGVLACPALIPDDGGKGALFLAERGQGAFVRALSGGEFREIHVETDPRADSFRFLESLEAAHGDPARQRAVAAAVGISRESLRMDSQVKYGLIALGKAVLYLRFPSPENPDRREYIWDHAAGSIIVEEAGGCVTDMNGRPLVFSEGVRMTRNRGVVVSNGVLHDRVLSVLTGPSSV